MDTTATSGAPGGPDAAQVWRANVDAALAEFNGLRAEVLARLSAMQTVLTLQVTVSGAIFSVVLAQPDTRLAVILIIPFTSCLLALRFVAQHFALVSIGRYIREQLSDRVPGGLGWEQWIAGTRPVIRRLGWSGPLLLSFPSVALVATAWFGLTSISAGEPGYWRQEPGLLALWMAAFAATAITFGVVMSMIMRRSRTPRLRG
jgi:hypothetical protein